MHNIFGYQIGDNTTIRELYLMIRTFPRHYKFECKCGVIHTQSSLEMYVECSECGDCVKLYHFAAGEEIHAVIEWVLLWLGIPKDKLLDLNLHPDDVEKEIDWSQHDKYFRVTAQDIEACRKQNIIPEGD